MKSMGEVIVMLSMMTRCAATPLSFERLMWWINIPSENNNIGPDMEEITEQQVMGALEELMKAGKVRSFVKEVGDPLNPDDWLYESIKSVD